MEGDPVPRRESPSWALQHRPAETALNLIYVKEFSSERAKNETAFRSANTTSAAAPLAGISQSEGENKGTRHEPNRQNYAYAVFDDTKCNSGLGQSGGTGARRRADPVNAGDRSKDRGGSTAKAQP